MITMLASVSLGVAEILLTVACGVFAVSVAVFVIVRKIKGKSGCGGCADCAHCNRCKQSSSTSSTEKSD